MRSFYSERTAEYVVVPAFGKILSALGDVAPIFFWKTREGNTVAEAIHGEDEVRVVAIFARRPKIDPTDTSLLQARINTSLFEFSKQASAQRITVFCGLPLTRNIFELRTAACLWFHLDPEYLGDEPVFNIRGRKFESTSFDYGDLRPLSKEEVLNIVKAQSQKLSWQEATKAMAELYRDNRESSGYYPWWLRNWRYKPMYFVIKESELAS